MGAFYEICRYPATPSHGTRMIVSKNTGSKFRAPKVLPLKGAKKESLRTSLYSKFTKWIIPERPKMIDKNQRR